jgi:uncharacterized protein (DUF1697 family)
MTTFIVLLRAVNVGGTGKLPMADLKRLCEGCGFANVETYIASGNVVLSSDGGEHHVKTRLEAALERYARKPVGVLVRTCTEMAAVLAANPFGDQAPHRTVAIFLPDQTTPSLLDDIAGQDGEKVALGRREIYVAYGDRMGRSKLRIPGAGIGTARNMNTVAKLAEMAFLRPPSGP